MRSVKSNPSDLRGMVPAGFNVDLSEHLVRVAQDGKPKLGMLLSKWEMLMVYFKHGLEIPLCLNPDDEAQRTDHRTCLTAVMAMGERIQVMSSSMDDGALENLGYSHGFVASNLRYLRETYEQWYVRRDPEVVEGVWKGLLDECPQST